KLILRCDHRRLSAAGNRLCLPILTSSERFLADALWGWDNPSMSESDDSGELRCYLDEAATEPLLSKEDQDSLAAAKDEGVEEARTRLIKANMRLVVAIARRYEGNGLSLPALVRAGHRGLERAVDKFDY